MIKSNILFAFTDQKLLTSKLMFIICFAFAMRVAVRSYTGGVDFWENGYTFLFALAQNIAAGKGIALGDHATAFRVPLYPMFLAIVSFGHQAFLPVLLAQSLIGAGTVWCAAMLSQEIFDNTAAAIIAAILTAIYPYYVVHDTALQENSLYTFLMALAVLLLLRGHRSGSVVTGASAGLALGAAVLTRANLAPIALFGPLWLAAAGGSQAAPQRQRIWAALFCAGMVMATLAPWLVRSYLLTGSAALSTQSGFFLWLGNNPYTFSRYPQESIDRSQGIALEALSLKEKKELQALSSNEASQDQWFLTKALEYMRENPWLTVGNGSRKIAAAFSWSISPRRSLWPNLIHALSYGPMMLLGGWSMWTGRKHWREHSIFYVQFLSFAIVTYMFFGHTSYRVYLDVYLIVFAARAIAAISDKRASNPGRPPGSAGGAVEV